MLKNIPTILKVSLGLKHCSTFLQGKCQPPPKTKFFNECFAGKMLIRTKSRNLPQIFCEWIIISKAVFKGITGTGTSKRSPGKNIAAGTGRSMCVHSMFDSCIKCSSCFHCMSSAHLGGLLWRPCGLRRCHWLHAVSHHCLGLNPSLGMWESCQWLGARQWFSPGIPVSSTTYNWQVTNKPHVIGINVMKMKFQIQIQCPLDAAVNPTYPLCCGQSRAVRRRELLHLEKSVADEAQVPPTEAHRDSHL